MYLKMWLGLQLPNAGRNRERGQALALVALKASKTKPSSLPADSSKESPSHAIVNRPQVLLLDEPLRAGLKLRKEMQHELKQIQQQVGITFIYVTHDQEEALTMSDTIVVIDQEIFFRWNSTEIYNEPKNAFVADFIGESNIIRGKMIRDKLVRFSNCDFECLDTGFAPNEDVDVVVRPEDVKIVEPSLGQLKGVVTSIIFKGVHYEMLVDTEDFQWMIHSTIPAPEGREIGMLLTPDDIHIMHIDKDNMPEGAEEAEE